MRTFNVSVANVLCALLLAGAARAVEPQITITPANPQAGDTVFVSIAGWLPDPCYEQTQESIRAGFEALYNITSTDLGVPCVQVIADYVLTDTLTGLPEGWYQVEAVERMYWPGGWLWRTDRDFASFVVGDSSTVLGDCTPCVAGDADGSGICNIADVVYLISRIFSGGPAPMCATEGDANQDGTLNISDVTRMIMFIFGGSPLELCSGQ